MSFGSKIPKHEEYEELKDTTYITSLRDLSQSGYEGYRDNYSKVNVFSPETQRSLDDYTNAVYKRAEGDFDRQYRDTMKRMANRNYGQFGTLNATPALYRTDMENLAQQRKLADMAYNKALYRESLVDNELRRRYNTLDMYNQMLGKGQIPYELDLQNWKIRNQNKDVQFQNAIANYNQKGNWGRAVGAFFDPLDIMGLREAFGPTYKAQIEGRSGGQLDGTKLLNTAATIIGTILGTQPGIQSSNSSSVFGSNSPSLMDAIMSATGGNQSLPYDIFGDIGNTPTTINFGR